MFYFIWPLALAVISNTVYQICAKSVPSNINPFASLSITYIVAAIASFIMYFLLAKEGSLMGEYSKLNWSAYALGLSIVGLEVGFIYAYKAGWSVGSAFIVQSAFLAVILILVGYFMYKEIITLNKIIGVSLCLAGLFFISRDL